MQVEHDTSECEPNLQFAHRPFGLVATLATKRRLAQNSRSTFYGQPHNTANITDNAG